MSYHIYTTPAFVLGSRSRGEADRLIYIYTRELGAIRAVATGVRLAKSKLAAHLNNYEYIQVSVVRGKDIWRITDAQSYEFFAGFVGSNGLVDLDHFEKAKTFRLIHARFLAFMKRMVQGESADQRLFDSLVGAWDFFKQKINQIDPQVFEALLMIRLIRRLGYMKKTTNLESFLQNDEYSGSILLDFASHKREAIREINTAIKESHL